MFKRQSYCWATAACLPLLILGNTIQSEHSEVSGEEGSSVTLKCTYSTSENGPYLYWYRQFPNRAPQYMVMRGAGTSRTVKTESGLFTEGHSADADKESTNLTISRLEAGDAAAYHCALQNQGNTKFIFGSGTKLLVLPKKKSETAAFVLGSDKDNKEDKARACLITDFSFHNISVTLNGSDVHVDPSVIKGEEQYSVVAFLPESKERSNFNCKVNGKTTGDNNDIENVCESDLAYVFESDEKLNSLSLMVLGLRVIFLKSIAFNVLMTVRAWMS